MRCTIFLSNRPRNKLLACMTAADLSALEPYLEPVALGLRQRWSLPIGALRTLISSSAA